MNRTVLPPLACFLIMAASLLNANTPATLQSTFEDDFYIGAAIGKPLFEESPRSTLELVKAQFDSVSSTNMLKWGPFNPRPNVFNHDLADAYADFGQRNNMYVVGHVLFWHNQTPKWVFREKGKAIGRDALLERMRARTQHVAERYGKQIDAWDVVNETIMHDGSLRDSPWTQTLGPSFVEDAFRIADEELPASTELFYNDYGMTAPKKREAVVKMVQELKAKGVRIDGIGMQGHWSINGPSIEEIEKSIIAFASTGVDVHITELDIDVLPRKSGMFQADIAKRYEMDPEMDPYADGLHPEVQQQLAERYAEIFSLFVKHRDKIKRVTFWGATDQYSWLNNWPIKGRTSYPLLFDREGHTKPAFDAVVGVK